MRDDRGERFPKYIPFYYRVFAKIRKFYRQTQVRFAEDNVRKHGNKELTPDGKVELIADEGTKLLNPTEAINKSAFWIDEDLEKPEFMDIAEKIDAVKGELDAKGLKYTNTAGTFLSRMFYHRSERTKLWENTWIIGNSGVKAGERVLDIGGASTGFSFYLASMGCSVDIIDNDWGNCGTIYNANYVAKQMGWDLKAHDKDVSDPLPFPDDHFDRVFSICTVEHLNAATRRFMMKEVGRVLKPGGIAGLTMCYCNDLEEPLTDKGLRFSFRDKLNEEIILPSGLRIHGNKELIDPDLNKDFLGALFLEK